jgi:MFS family permease
MRLPQTLRSLRHRDFRLYFLGQAVSFLGSWMQTVAQGWLVYELTRSAFWLGLVGFCSTIPFSLFSLWAGRVADRLPKRSLLMLLQVASAGIALLLGSLVYLHWVTPSLVALLSFCAGVARALETPTRQAFLVELVGREDLANAVALNSSLFNGARLLGPALGGWLVAVWGAGSCFFANAGSFLFALGCLWLMETQGIPSPALERSSADFQEVWHFLLRSTQELLLLVLLGVVSLFGWFYSTILPLFAGELLHGGPHELGLLVSSNGFGALAGALAVARYGSHHRARLLWVLGVGLFCLGIFGLAVSRSLGVACVTLWGIGFGLVLFNSSCNICLQEVAPDRVRGRLMGIYVFLYQGLFPFASLLGGWLAHELGASRALLLGDSVCASATLLVLGLSLRKAKGPRHPLEQTKELPFRSPTPPS